MKCFERIRTFGLVVYAEVKAFRTSHLASRCSAGNISARAAFQNPQPGAVCRPVSPNFVAGSAPKSIAVP